MTTSTFTSLMVKENYASMLESLKRFGLPLFEYYYFASHSNEKAWEFHLDNTRLLMTIYKFFFTYGEGKLYKYIRWSQNMMTMTFFNFSVSYSIEKHENSIYISNLISNTCHYTSEKKSLTNFLQRILVAICICITQ